MIGRKASKRILPGLLSGILILTACRQTSSPTQTAPAPVVGSTTVIASPIPIATQTILPSATPTASITPLPTIPTFTPTFDARTIVTVTPAPRAECPSIDSKIKPEDYLPEKLDYPTTADVTNNILEFLNGGGDGQALVRRLDQIYPKVQYSDGYAFLDVTGDHVPEFLYVELSYGKRPIVFSCRNGEHEVLAILSGQHDFDFHDLKVEDLISSGIPQIIVTGTDGVSFPQSSVYLYQWNARTFSTLGRMGMLALRETQFKDIDGNGIREIMLTGDNPVCTSCSNFIPQRERAVTYGWNGKEFVEMANEFEPPKYRFQAVQDADAAAIIGDYGKALRLYEEAISNKNLEWWSPERLTYEQHIGDPVYMFIATPSAVPREDITEYPRLAAYVYYRLMLIHLMQGNEIEAETAYKTLQEELGSDQYGRPYFEMATAFWNALQSTHKIYNGCAAAIQYAAKHPEILIPLGSDYHGWQSHTYEPADVCPFR